MDRLNHRLGISEERIGELGDKSGEDPDCNRGRDGNWERAKRHGEQNERVQCKEQDGRN